MTASMEDQLARYGRILQDAMQADSLARPESDHREPRRDSSRDASSPTETSAPRPRQVVAGAVAACVVLVATLVVVVGSPGPAWAGWTPSVQSASAADSAAVEDVCRAQPEMSSAPALLALDVRGDGGAAIFGDETNWVACQARRPQANGAFEVTSVWGGAASDVEEGRRAVLEGSAIATVALGWRGEPGASLVWGVKSDEVDRIELQTADGRVEPVVAGDIWVAWWPSGDAEESTLRATDTAGAILDDGPAGSLAPSPDVRPSSTVATWPELTDALDRWQRCVLDQGYVLTIEIDATAQTYQAISPTVSVPAAESDPDDRRGEQLLAPIDAVINRCYVSEVRQSERR